jgi:carboxymethylenebutenolidase
VRGPLPVAELYLGGIPRGAVVLLVGSGQLPGADETMNVLAEHGYESIAADLSRGGDSAGLTDDGLVEDVLVLLARLGDRRWTYEQIGLLGYGLGARASLLAAADLVLGSAISVDPIGVASSPTESMPPLVDHPRAARTPWLGMVGELDDHAPPRSAIDLDTALRVLSPAYTELVRYPGVTGAFYRDSREPVAHAASFDSLQRVLEWLNAHVAPRLTPLAEAWQLRHSPDSRAYGE